MSYKNTESHYIQDYRLIASPLIPDPWPGSPSEPHHDNMTSTGLVYVYYLEGSRDEKMDQTIHGEPWFLDESESCCLQSLI